MIRVSKKLSNGFNRKFTTQITRLSNGLRVATLPSEASFASAGLMIDAGSRMEDNFTHGCAHFMDRLTFKSTRDYTSTELVKQIELLGGLVSSQATREFLLYQGQVFNDQIPTLVHLLSQIVTKPALLESEIEDAKTQTRYELEDLKWKHDQTLPELLHSVAYRNKTEEEPLRVTSLDHSKVNTLGRSVKILPQNLIHMNREKIEAFRKLWFTPDRMVLVGVGVDHCQMVQLAEKEFGDLKTPTEEVKELQREKSVLPKYSGGVFIDDTSEKEQDPNPDSMELTHLQVAFETVAVTDPDIYALATLGSLLGGGGSFSAGGPGKGMYTRLYTQVLNRQGWIESCNVLNFTYQHSGLFGITISVPSDKRTHQHVASVLCDQLMYCTTTCSNDELQRAKNQLKSNILMSLESQSVELEDIGRQILANGTRIDPEELCKRIDMVTCADLIRVARRTFLGEDLPSRFTFNDGICKPWTRTGDKRPTVLVQGNLTGSRDSLYDIEGSLVKWGLLDKSLAPQSHGRKFNLFSKI